MFEIADQLLTCHSFYLWQCVLHFQSRVKGVTTSCYLVRCLSNKLKNTWSHGDTVYYRISVIVFNLTSFSAVNEWDIKLIFEQKFHISTCPCNVMLFVLTV